MKISERIRRSANGLMTLTVLFIMLAFGLLTISGGTVDFRALACGAALSFMLILCYSVMIRVLFRFDRLLFVVISLLIAIGIIIQYRVEPGDAQKQLIMLLAGIIACFIVQWAIRYHEKLRRFIVPMMFASLGLLAALLFLGRELGGAKNWISIAGFSMQPSEFVKIVLVLALAHVFDSARKLTSMLPALGFAVVCTVILVMEKDLGAALLFALTTLTVFFAATGRKLLTLLGLGAGALGAYASYQLFDHVKYRVAVFRDPWALYEGSGYQIAQGLMAMASGGLFGMGLGLGSPKTIPAYHTDYIFAVICEEFGVIMGVCVIALYIVFIIRGLIIALHAPCRFLTIAAMGCTFIIAFQSFIIIGGVIKLIPLTGITLPYVSHGGSSIISCMMMFGILQGIASLSDSEGENNEY